MLFRIWLQQHGVATVGQKFVDERVGRTRSRFAIHVRNLFAQCYGFVRFRPACAAMRLCITVAFCAGLSVNSPQHQTKKNRSGTEQATAAPEHAAKEDGCCDRGNRPPRNRADNIRWFFWLEHFSLLWPMGLAFHRALLTKFTELLDDRTEHRRLARDHACTSTGGRTLRSHRSNLWFRQLRLSWFNLFSRGCVELPFENIAQLAPLFGPLRSPLFSCALGFVECRLQLPFARPGELEFGLHLRAAVVDGAQLLSTIEQERCEGGAFFAGSVQLIR